LGLEQDLSNTKSSEHKQHLNEQLIDVDRMNRLVSDLLTLSKLDESTGDLKMSEVDTQKVLKDAIKQLEPLARKDNIKVSFTPSKKDLFVLADYDLLFRALQNVIKNAIIYNNKDGSVDISVAEKEGQVVFEVKDSGPGISVHQLEAVFERFTRLDTSRSSQIVGSGLGLPIVRSIVESFGGVIALKSTEGKGTKAIIKIPIHRAS